MQLIVKSSVAAFGIFLPADYVIQRTHFEYILIYLPPAVDSEFAQCAFEMIHSDTHINILNVYAA